MQKVVAHLRDGRVLKGTSLDVAPNRPTCHVRPPDGPAVEVRLNDLKALFFVRTLEGDAEHDEERAVDPEDRRALGSTVVRLTFGDGEEMTGLTNRYPPTQPFFFIVPVDPGSNNLRILINRSAVVAMDPVLVV
jgi:hypothetical protein